MADGLAPGDTVSLSYRHSSATSSRAAYFVVSRAGQAPANAQRSPSASETKGPATIVFALEPNRPNPFSGETELRYSVPGPGLVRLEIFDVSGRRVRRLVHGYVPAGAHSVSWNRRTDGGSNVPPGIYLYRLAAGGQRAERKMTVLP